VTPPAAPCGRSPSGPRARADPSAGGAGRPSGAVESVEGGGDGAARAARLIALLVLGGVVLR
jgi:hypothetical protein